MRRFGLQLFILCSTLTAQEPVAPRNHPPLPDAGQRGKASDLTERLRPSVAGENAAPVSRRNLIDEFIFAKLEKDGVPHAPLSSDEEFFRRVHIDLTGRIPHGDELRGFVSSRDPQKRDKLIDALT